MKVVYFVFILALVASINVCGQKVVITKDSVVFKNLTDLPFIVQVYQIEKITRGNEKYDLKINLF